MQPEIIGIDLGGTQLRGGVVKNGELLSVQSHRISSGGSADEVLREIYSMIDKLIDKSITAIGIGVPGLVSNNVVFDVMNIPAWKKIPLRKIIEERYKIPVAVNNDANCFALGEFHFGKGKDYDAMLGLTIGTGLGSGLIINKKLYEGENGGAGEFGMIDYLDKNYEYYASGQFFNNVHGIDGEQVFNRAQQGDEAAIKMYEEMGMHLGNAIKAILYAIDVPLIVLGGSVRQAFPFFSKTMRQQVTTFAYSEAIKNLQIEISELENSGILGAAALHF